MRADHSQVGDDVELIHPFDMYVLLQNDKNVETMVVHSDDKRKITVQWVDQEGAKSYTMECEVVEVDGKKYVQTTTVRPKTHLFDHMDCACNGTHHKVGDHERMDAEKKSGAA